MPNRGVGVIAPELELFRDWLLPMIPERRLKHVVYFAPGDPDNPLTFCPFAIEPGEDRSRAAGDLYAIFRRAIGDEAMGARMAPIVANCFGVLVGRPHTTFWDVKRLLEDRKFRELIAAETDDPYMREFWLKTYESYPKGAHLPIINRLDQFLRPKALRKALTHPVSSFSIRQCLSEGLILLLDLSRLPPDAMLLLGQMLLSKFQIELMRREAVPLEERRPFYLFADEFQTFSGVSESTWRELLSRGRRYGLRLTLAHQYPGQLPHALRDEIFGNAGSMLALTLGFKDAQAVRGEFLEPSRDGRPAKPVPSSAFVSLRTGRGIARLGGGSYALRVTCTPPIPQPSREWGEVVRETSWRLYGNNTPPPPTFSPNTASAATSSGPVEEDEVLD